DEKEPENLTSKRQVKQKGPTIKIKRAKTVEPSSLDDEEPENLTSKRKVKQKGPTNKIKRTKIIEQSSPEISEDEYRELLQDISEWFDGNSCISMLKVLYRDHVTNANILHNATKMRDLLDNLHDSGNLSPTDLSILYDTINVTKQFGFKPKNKKLLSLFQNVRSFEISKFTSHRQKLVKLGMALIQDDVATLDGSFNTRQKKYEDSWHLINDLEHRTVICEGKMEAFVKKLSEFQLHSAVKALTEGTGNVSSNSGQASDKDEVIRKYLLNTQRKVCSNANQFTPSIFNPEYHVDIACMFTDLDLLKISKNREKEDADMFTDLDQLTISKYRKKEDATQTTLKQVLDDIKSTPACKALIEGDSGVGKSTLLRYIAYNWAKNESDETFKGKIVFLVNIQDIDIGETILDAILSKINLQGFQLETGLIKEPILIKRFIWSHSNEIVLLLDGLDELKDGSESPIKIFKNQEMCECKVVLTSRSEKIYEFINASNLHVKVQGFSTENIEKYIRKHFDFFTSLGDSLIDELQLDKHQEVYSMYKNPLLLLSVSIMWEERRYLPADKTDLFKEVFRCILNQFIDKQTVKEQKISAFEDTPERFVNAMALLGKYFYKGLKKNQLSINRREMKEDKELVALALKLGFVYKDTPKLKSNFEEIFTTRHKLIVESLVGFYLCKLCQIQGLKNKCSNGMGTLFEPLTDNEWKMISRSKHLHVTKVFAIGFLGGNAGIFLNHWITNDISTYRSLMEYLRCVNEDHMGTVEKAVIGHMTRVDLKIKPHINDICAVMNNVIRECLNRGVKLELQQLFVSGNDLSDIDGSSFASLFISPKLNILGMNNCSLSSVIVNNMIEECSSRGVKLGMNNCSLSGVIVSDMIRECFSRGVKLELKELYIRDNNLSDIDGSLLASLSITPKLSTLDMNNCNLSSVVINDMIKECSSRGVKLEVAWLSVSGNNLSDVDGSSFASLFISPKLNRLGINNCSLSGVIVNDMIRECFSRGVKLELKELYIRGNDLRDINGSSFSSLFITSKLNKLDLNNCSLSCVIMNDMIRECFRRRVKLELKELNIGGNNLSDVDWPSFASLFITPNLNRLCMNNCSLSSVIVNDIIRECSKRGVKLKLE
ncbi:uncharacterized protein LOC117104287, partial [Anneissia japonica]|uniref:uncharacterized protein LOC117104287 n=1 Tax=Anneissia japonica TaxID=1529436 RepID=UPI001425B718